MGLDVANLTKSGIVADTAMLAPFEGYEIATAQWAGSNLHRAYGHFITELDKTPTLAPHLIQELQKRYL